MAEPVGHQSYLGAAGDRFGNEITLDCVCGWTVDMGYGPSVEKIAAAWIKHLEESE